MKTATDTTVTIQCCGDASTFDGAQLNDGEMASLTCNDCGVVHYVAKVVDYSKDPVDLAPVMKVATTTVSKDEVPALLVNLHGGEVLCAGHAGSQLTSAMKARPRAKRWDTSFGTYARVTVTDVAEWKMAGLTMECETCRYR